MLIGRDDLNSMFFTGSRFALMELKLMLYYLLSEFSIEACDRTTIPLRYSGSMALAPEGDLIVQLKKRKN